MPHRLPTIPTRILFIVFCARFHPYIHAWALIAAARGLSLVEIALMESFTVATVFLCEVPTGALADRFGRKWAVAFAFLCLAAVEIGLLLTETLPAGVRAPFWVYALEAALTGMGWASFSGALEAVAYEAVAAQTDEPARTMTRFMSRWEAVGAAAFVMAPLVGSLILGDAAGLAGDARPEWVMAITAAMLIAAGLAACTLPRDRGTAREDDRPRPWAIVGAGVRHIARTPELARLAAFSIFTSTFGALLIGTLAAPYLNGLGVSPLFIGLALSAGSGAGGLGVRAVPWLAARWGERRALIALAAAPGAAYLLLGAAGLAGAGGGVAWVLIWAIYTLQILRAPLISALGNRAIAPAVRATVLSLVNMGVNVYTALAGTLVAAVAGVHFGVAFAGLGVVILAAALFFGRRLERGYPPPPAPDAGTPSAL